jgi:hypothetical protein
LTLWWDAVLTRDSRRCARTCCATGSRTASWSATVAAAGSPRRVPHSRRRLCPLRRISWPFQPECRNFMSKLQFNHLIVLLGLFARVGPSGPSRTATRQQLLRHAARPDTEPRARPPSWQLRVEPVRAQRALRPAARGRRRRRRARQRASVGQRRRPQGCPSPPAVLRVAFALRR